jgi:hypothetical protein
MRTRTDSSQNITTKLYVRTVLCKSIVILLHICTYRDHQDTDNEEEGNTGSQEYIHVCLLLEYQLKW